MSDSTNSANRIVDQLEEILEERKRSTGRRKAFSPLSPHSAPKLDRRSGKDRRHNADKEH